jgi:hypothetical protein
VDDPECASAHRDARALVDKLVSGYVDPLGVVPAGDRRRAGPGHHLGERLPVVLVPVGGDDPLEPAVTDQPQQRGRVVRRVDQHLLVGLAAAEQVGVVVHRPDGDLRDHQLGQLVGLHGTADLDVSVVLRHAPSWGTR